MSTNHQRSTTWMDIISIKEWKIFFKEIAYYVKMSVGIPRFRGEHMSNTKKTLQDLTIRDSFLFAAVMQHGDNCKKFLEMLLNIKIDKIDILYEKTIIYNPEYKGIRLDVFAKGDNHICYNVEMQVLADKLPKRSRYYHSQMNFLIFLLLFVKINHKIEKTIRMIM